MLSFQKVTLLLFLLLEGSHQEGDQWLATCQTKNNISVDFNESAISINCSQINNDVVESDIKCAYAEYKAKHSGTRKVTEVSMLEISKCRVYSNLTIEKILHLLEGPEGAMKNIRVVKNKALLSPTQLTGLQSVTNFYIDDLENNFNLETLIILPHLKELTIKCKVLQNISNKTFFGELENFYIAIDGYSSTEELGDKNILRDLMSMSGKFKIFKLFHNHQSTGLRSIVIEKESFGDNNGLEVLEITKLVDRVEKQAFDNLQHLRELRIVWGKITTIHPEILPTSLKILDLSYNEITSFIGEAHLTNLEELILNNNEIETFDGKTLPSSLKILNLSYNELTSFIGGAHLTNLEELRLHDNQIETFDAKILPSSLKILDLSFNGQTSFIGGAHLTNLEELRLHDNEIETFDIKTLQSPLKILDLSYNELTSFTGGAHLTNLEELRLNSNQIETFDAKTLSLSLKILDLSYNGITSFIGGAHLTNLEELGLNGNQIKKFNAKILPSSIKMLDLLINQLTSFIGGTHLTNLEELILNNNRFETFDVNTLPSSLKSLHLSNNRLTTFIGGTHLTTLEELRLRSNQFKIFDTNSLPSSLKLLDLTANKLREFVIEKHFSYLEELNLAFNQIFSFTLNLEKLPKLRIISLNANHLKWLNVFGSWTSSLKEVNLDNNDIQNLDAWQWIYEHQENVSHDGTYPVCACNLQKNDTQPLNRWLICRLLIPESFLIHVYEFECQTKKPNWFCKTYKSLNSQFMNCSKYPLPRYNFFDPVKTLHIYFSGNQRIHFLPQFPEKIKNRNINVYIYAESCRITHPFLVNNLTQILNLERLHMANNNISEIEVSALRMLEKKRTKLTLSGNPFKCDCDHQLMYDTITQMRPLIEDYDQMTCDDGSKFIPNRSLCFQWQTFFLSFAVVVFVIISGLAIFYIFFSLEVKIFIYSRGWFPAMFRPNSDGQTYVYDVFVSYSDLDEDYVYSIIDYLEHGISPPLKVCHHNRDWIGGDRIDRQIINSVEASRKTLIIFSRNFLTSYWGSLEFRTAFLTMLHEKTSKLVLVVYGDLGPLDELKPEIRSYIKTTTYIASDNKWFWKRLAYALRRPKDAKMEDEKENDVSEEVIVESAV